MLLQGKRIIIGICGSIAAYKIASLTRLLVKKGVGVQIIMTPESKEFITPLTLAALSKNPVLSDYYNPQNGEWHNHVELGLKADLLLIAPASANTLSKMAQGACDNLLLATYLSARCPVFFAPAMDLDMWKHPTTQANVAKLISYGNKVISPGTGELASGLVGEGRLAEPEEILEFIVDFFSNSLPLKGKKALVTAGPTYEAIDPVRFIGNHSSGKMGYAIAEQLKRLGATVTLISGPTSLPKPAGVTTIPVLSAQQMFDNCKEYFPEADILVMSAAVADYTPLEVATQKIKKITEDFTIQLKKTNDILAFLGAQKQKKQTVVGFALETNNELENAKNKLIRKNLDFIVLNSMQDQGAGFGSDTNKITIISKNNQESKYQLKSKTEVAKDICRHIIEHQNFINS
ncbi:bifunctional phosphopantothenoylcysteine decarboxylase/phosphopantothenate--cysteine ligase CoaBC [Sphingobacterium sp. UT-1RO-CII-1]|uniref:bifunctional phosphopantothenoylcysteine decarboxylase/phosphopantothenate--cysteine ligase CoaBC n=1 Tax=Sphingobacterium sp. UT-1RO-CII-1 TaxID=2995225 RepID=UPI00227BBFEB|nr:bifunctional phosphopantothenoylcysteine decarboxylase/phosphopantothenate--cysteine ligase CoaBC [Sphingobacterium sp. UT-1RO-CII-1]MCY4780944.1 bifunctional phosphopantothenoylcysteine decarboxylase/phosphopantothenate--cysteine ligase CoaBC [Sphingobacterium sp. UT-1RO-CII-1]